MNGRNLSHPSDRRPSQSDHAGTGHAGLSPTRETVLIPARGAMRCSADRMEGELHPTGGGGAGGTKNSNQIPARVHTSTKGILFLFVFTVLYICSVLVALARFWMGQAEVARASSRAHCDRTSAYGVRFILSSTQFVFVCVLRSFMNVLVCRAALLLTARKTRDGGKYPGLPSLCLFFLGLLLGGMGCCV